MGKSYICTCTCSNPILCRFHLCWHWSLYCMVCIQISLWFLLCDHTDGLVTPFLSLKAEKQQDKKLSWKRKLMSLLLKKISLVKVLDFKEQFSIYVHALLCLTLYNVIKHSYHWCSTFCFQCFRFSKFIDVIWWTRMKNYCSSVSITHLEVSWFVFCKTALSIQHWNDSSQYFSI